MTERPPVERRTTFATTVLNLGDAFAFVMAHLEQVDELIEIEIRPTWSSDDSIGKRFSVSVSGVAELPPYEPGSL